MTSTNPHVVRHYEEACKAATIAAREDEKLNAIIERFTQWNTFSWTALKLMELRELLGVSRSALELGSGMTTIVLGRVFEERGGYLTSFEQSEAHVKLYEERLEELQPAGSTRLNFPAYVREVDVISIPDRGICYDWRSWGCEIPDFLYVDGPDNRIEGSTEQLICLDAELIAMSANPPATIVFDCRASTVRSFMLSPAANKYDIEPSAFWVPDDQRPWYLQSMRHHTVARLKA